MNKKLVLAILGGGAFAAGCHTDMWVQPRTNTADKSAFYDNRESSRHPVEGTVAIGQQNASESMYRGRSDGKLVTTIPIPVDMKVLRRGQERFEIFCSHCHGRAGDGNGMIAQRGLSLVKKPASFHTQRLREMPVGHFFDVITNGYGIMFNQAANIEPKDRWAIAAYIRALQFSQNATLDDVPEEHRSKLIQTKRQGGER